MAVSQVLELSPEEAELVIASRQQKEAVKVLKPYGLFKVLVGTHFEALDQELHHKTTGPFWASSNLCKRFGEDKFRLLKLAENIEPEEDQDAPDLEDDEEQEDTYSTMTLDELKTHAAENGVNLGRAKTADAIVKLLRKHDSFHGADSEE